MKKLAFTYWQEEAFFIGFFNAYPDYSTQGRDKDELMENLRSLLADMESGEIPYLRRVEELMVA